MMGLADRLRGSGWFTYCRQVGMVAMGIITAVMLHTHGWIAAYVITAVYIGAVSGWMNPLAAAFEKRPMNANYEWWQRGILRKSTFAALAFRGAMWGALLLPIHPGATLAYIIAFTASPYIARNFPTSWDTLRYFGRWGLMEFGRGAAIAALLLFLA
jgi:hypothetical protein